VRENDRWLRLASRRSTNSAVTARATRHASLLTCSAVGMPRLQITNSAQAQTIERTMSRLIKAGTTRVPDADPDGSASPWRSSGDAATG
jgi:hypothetical protein